SHSADIVRMHAFPHGSEEGTFVHGLIKRAARRGSSAVEPTEVRDMIARRCAVRGWSAWIDPLSDWLLTFVRTGFHIGLPDASALLLDALDSSLPELEFWLPAEGVHARRLDSLVSAATLDGLS